MNKSYTQEFIAEVKKLYPGDETIAKLAEDGNPFLGRYLDDSSAMGIGVDEILTATSLEAIQEKARKMKRRREIYGEYWEQPPAKRD